MLNEPCGFWGCSGTAVARAKHKTLIGYVRYCKDCLRITKAWGIETVPLRPARTKGAA
jgi:hypothetical protein